MTRIVESKQDVLNSLRENRDRFKALGVHRLGLFGFFVRGDQGPESDVDFLVEFEAGEKTFDHFMAVSFLLEEILQRHVEVVTPESLSPYLGPAILREVEYVPIAA